MFFSKKLNTTETFLNVDLDCCMCRYIITVKIMIPGLIFGFTRMSSIDPHLMFL